MLFAKPGVYPPCGLFNIKHLVLFIITIFGVIFASKHTNVNNKENIKRIIKNLTITIWILEIVKTIFYIIIGDGMVVNKMVPLYYCSLLLYAGIFSSACKGVIQRVGNVFLATGGIVAGIVFLMFPTTSLPEYPVLHFISLHSFFFHGVMIYIGIIINKSTYIVLEGKDIIYYSCLILSICIGAYIVNNICGSNLMFISRDFPGMPITIVYKLTGKFFPVVMSLIQMTIPFYIIYWTLLIKNKYKNRKKVTA